MSRPRIFLGVPVFREPPDLLRDALKSFLQPYVEVFAVDNGASNECKGVLWETRGEMLVTHNVENVYINPAWNQIARRFLVTSDADVLVIANADATVNAGWDVALVHAIDTGDGRQFWHGRCVSESGELLSHPRHTAGVFFAIPRELVAKCFPIPSELRMWYGDSWIWRQMERAGAKPHVIEEIRVWHAGSVSSAQVPEMREIVEADRIAWERLSRE